MQSKGTPSLGRRREHAPLARVEDDRRTVLRGMLREALCRSLVGKRADELIPVVDAQIVQADAVTEASLTDGGRRGILRAGHLFELRTPGLLRGGALRAESSPLT